MSELIIRSELEVQPNISDNHFFVLKRVTENGYTIEKTNHGGYGDTFEVQITKSEIPPMEKAITSGLYIFCGAFDDHIVCHPKGEANLELVKRCIKIAQSLMVIESRYEAQHKMLDQLDVLFLGLGNK